jgi:1-acyl-sn-glycerol-3-phosphate acyltransferase
MLYTIFRSAAVVLCKVFFRIRARGRKNIPRKGGFILASNHLSYLDPVVLGVACPRKLNFMAKHDLFRSPLFSGLIARLGAFAVKRDSADASALKEAVRRVRKGRALLIFPEGSRGQGGKLGEPQSGIGFLAAKLNVPVIPAFIKGTERALPKNARRIQPSKVEVSFGQQVAIDKGLTYQEIAARIMSSIASLGKQ